MEFNFDKFTLQIDDYFVMESSSLIVIRMAVPPDFFHSELKPFIYDHQKDESQFEYHIDNQEFFGRFGQLTFDKLGNIQLFITTKILEKPNPHTLTSMVVSRYSAEYVNLVKVVKSHEQNFNQLLSILVNQNIVSDQELSNFNFPLELKEISDFNREVEDLSTFLEENHRTILEIKNNAND